MAITDNVETSMAPPQGLRVPTRPEELDAVWLTGCLRHARELGEHQRVTAFTAITIGQGRGFAGRIVRVALQYEPAAPQAPASLVAKFASQHAPTREMLGEVDGYAREVRFYRELAPAIGIGTPRCYFAHYDRAQGQFCLLLEDLAPAASADREQGFSVEQAKLVLDQLAALHAHNWNRVEQLSWLALGDELLARIRDRFLAGVPRFVERYAAEFPTLARAARGLQPFLLGSELIEESRRPPLTLAHNDLHIENVFLPTAQGGRFAVIDWQSVAIARYGTSDVARVMCMGLRPEQRRKHGRALLRHYHRALRSHGVRDYSLRALSFRYRQELVSAVLIAVLAFDTLDFSGEEGNAPRLLASRVDSALADAHVNAILAVLGAWLRIRRWLARLFGSRARAQ